MMFVHLSAVILPFPKIKTKMSCRRILIVLPMNIEADGAATFSKLSFVSQWL